MAYAEHPREEAAHDETGEPGAHATSLTHRRKRRESAGLPGECAARHLRPDRREGEAEKRREHRDRDGPPEDGEHRPDGLMAHHLRVAGGQHDDDEEEWRRGAIQDRREEKGVDRFYARERDDQPDDRRESDDPIKGPRPSPIL